MRFHTLEQDFEYNVKQILKQFKEEAETTASGEELEEMLWQYKELLGEIFYNHIMDYFVELDELED